MAYESTSKKDNLAKRNWNDSMKCCICSKSKTIRYLFFSVFTLDFFGVFLEITHQDIHSTFLTIDQN